MPDSVRVLAMDEIEPGLTAEFEWQVAEADLDAFAALSGDRNPLHMDTEFARSRGFPDRASHGYLFGAKVSALVGMLLPGRDCLILETGLAFPKPIHPGDRILVSGEVESVSRENNILRVKVRGWRIEGERKVLVARGFVLCQNR